MPESNQVKNPVHITGRNYEHIVIDEFAQIKPNQIVSRLLLSTPRGVENDFFFDRFSRPKKQPRQINKITAFLRGRRLP